MKLENKIRKTLLILVIIIMGVILYGCKGGNGDGPDEPGNQPDQLTKNLFNNFSVITSSPVIEDKVEFAVYEVQAGYVEEHYNPYDYTQINLYADIIDPENNITRVYGFWYRDYEITINTNYNGTISGVSGTPSTDPNEIQGLEQVKWLSDEFHFRFRFTPTITGTHNVTIVVEEDGEQIQKIENNIVVNENPESNYHGIIKIDNSTNRHFVDGNDKTFILNGLNLCWWSNSLRKTYDYDVWFDYLSSNNGNFARIWMATWGFCQHWQSYDNFDKGQTAAARLDKVMQLADDYNLYIQLCLLNHGQFSSETNSEWNKNPYNVDNGGFLKSPAQFFSNDEAKRVYKMELRYLVARYGYSDKLLSWELFNEVDWTDGAESYNMTNVKTWHKEMATFIKENDPYNHLITTSYKYMNKASNLAYSLPEIDYISVHSYDFNGANVNKKLPAEVQAVMTKYNKPVHVGEIGIDWQSGNSSYFADPGAISIRQALWAGMMSGSLGGAMQWWWESWIHPHKLYYLFEGTGIYSSKMDLTGSDYSLLSKDNSSLSSDKAGLLGYSFDDRVYGYVYNNSWSYVLGTPGNITSLNVSVSLNNGTYGVTYYNTVSGEIVSSSTVKVENGTGVINVPTFNEDIAFIIE